MYVTDWLRTHKQLEKIGGTGKMVQLLEKTVASINVDRYAELVLEKFIRRQLVTIGNQTINLAYEGLDLDQGLQVVEQSVLEIAQLRQPVGEAETDSEYRRYQKLIELIRELELKIADPGYRAWKLQILAKRYDRSPRQLEDLYFKSLIAEENGDLMDFDEMLLNHGSSVREWLQHGFIPRKTSILLHAEGGVGKTRLAYDFVYHIATGADWNGFPGTGEPNKCLIIQTDEPASDMLQALIDRGVTNDLPIRYKTKWTVDHIQSLRQEVAEYLPRFIVIDSLTAVSRHSLFSENDTEYARPILMFRDIAEEFDCTIIIIHHSNGAGGARGTRAIFNSVSEVWSLKRPPENTTPDAVDRTLTIEKSRARCPARYRLQFNPEDKSWHCLGKEGEEDNTPTVRVRDAIVKFLVKRWGVPHEVSEIHQVIGGSQDHLRRTAAELAAEGVINRKRQHRNEPYRYFIGGRGEGSDPRSPNDHPTISQHDQPANAGELTVLGLAGREIVKNAIFNSEIEEEKSRSHDQPTSQIEQPAENSDIVSDSAAETGVIVSVGVRSHDQPITPAQAAQNLTLVDRKPRKGDRIRHFGRKFGTIMQVNKGLAKYEILWDGAKRSEVYSQREFNRSDFDVFEVSQTEENFDGHTQLILDEEYSSTVESPVA
jgi:replicative DNA helicase